MRRESRFGAGINFRLADGTRLDEIVYRGRVFYVGERTVKPYNPLPPWNIEIPFNPDLSLLEEDRFPPAVALIHAVNLIYSKNRNLIKGRNGFVVWEKIRNQTSEHIIEGDDYVQISDLHRFLIQFFSYKFPPPIRISRQDKHP